MLLEDDLRIKKSTIPGAGLGLFNGKKTIKKGEVVTKYDGERLTRQQVEDRYPDDVDDGKAEYVLCNNDDTVCLDARNTTSCAARFSNSKRRDTGIRGNNAEFRDHRTKWRDMVARKKIKPGKEVFTWYGDDYAH